MVERIGLAEAIEQLRVELGRAQDAGLNQQLRFEVAEVQVELLVELHREGNVKFGVVTVGAGGSTGSSHTHKLTLKLNVRDEATGGRTAQVVDGRGRAWNE